MPRAARGERAEDSASVRMRGKRTCGGRDTGNHLGIGPSTGSRRYSNGSTEWRCGRYRAGSARLLDTLTSREPGLHV